MSESSEELRELELRIVKIESALFNQNDVQGVIGKLTELWEAFWAFHDKTWIDFLHKERRALCFYLREKQLIRKNKQFSMAKVAFVTKEIAEAVAILVILLKVFKVIPL